MTPYDDEIRKAWAWELASCKQAGSWGWSQRDQAAFNLGYQLWLSQGRPSVDSA